MITKHSWEIMLLNFPLFPQIHKN